MYSLRRLSHSHRRCAMLLLGLALAVRLLVPAGFMPTAQTGKILTLAMCNGTGPVTISIPMKDRGGSGHETDHKAGHQPCAFSGLNAPAMAAADPALIAAALTFAFVVALLALPLPPLRRARHLRPPLRGPPATA